MAAGSASDHQQTVTPIFVAILGQAVFKNIPGSLGRACRITAGCWSDTGADHFRRLQHAALPVSFVGEPAPGYG